MLTDEEAIAYWDISHPNLVELIFEELKTRPPNKRGTLIYCLEGYDISLYIDKLNEYYYDPEGSWESREMIKFIFDGVGSVLYG